MVHQYMAANCKSVTSMLQLEERKAENEVTCECHREKIQQLWNRLQVPEEQRAPFNEHMVSSRKRNLKAVSWWVSGALSWFVCGLWFEYLLPTVLFYLSWRQRSSGWRSSNCKTFIMSQTPFAPRSPCYGRSASSVWTSGRLLLRTSAVSSLELDSDQNDYLLFILWLHVVERFTEELLSLHDAENKRLKQHYEDHKELFDGVHQWEESWRLFLELDVSNRKAAQRKLDKSWFDFIVYEV